MLLYTVQIFSFLACMMSAICKRKKNILLWVFIANTSNFLVMLLANETDGWANSLATCLRSLLFLYKDKVKTNTILYSSVLLHLVCFLFSYQDLWSILLIFATLVVCVSQWFGNTKQIKIWAFVSVSCWLIYTIHIKLYLDIPKRLLEMLLLIISLMSYRHSKETSNTNQVI